MFCWAPPSPNQFVSLPTMMYHVGQCYLLLPQRNTLTLPEIESSAKFRQLSCHSSCHNIACDPCEAFCTALALLAAVKDTTFWRCAPALHVSRPMSFCHHASELHHCPKTLNSAWGWTLPWTPDVWLCCCCRRVRSDGSQHQGQR